MKNKKINWCLKQKNGISLVEPNENLMYAYLKKSENSLSASKNVKGNFEWEISSAYYTMYFGIYAIMMKIGIKSEIHSCSVEFVKEFLNDKFSLFEIELLEDAREIRNKVQYYIVDIEEIDRYKEVLVEVLDFYLKCKKVAFELTQKEISKIREELQ